MKFLPQTQAAKLQLLERRSEHILGNHEPAFGRHDETLRRERAVCHLRSHTVKHPHGSQKLPDHIERAVEIDSNPPLLGEIQDVGQTHSGHPFRRDGQAGGWIAQALRTPNAAEGLATKTLERGRPFAQGELEAGCSGQRGSQAKDLDELANGVVERTHPHPEPVLERACSYPESRDVWGG